MVVISPGQVLSFLARLFFLLPGSRRRWISAIGRILFPKLLQRLALMIDEPAGQHAHAALLAR